MPPATLPSHVESLARVRPSGVGAPVPRAEMHPRVSCVIPCFNEAENLRRLLPALIPYLRERFGAWELVLVDDGSGDDSAEVIEHWTRLSPVHALQLSRNFGKEAALCAGLEVARGDVVVMLDADLQHPHELIETMVERWRAGADVVYAMRNGRSDEGWLKRLGAALFYRLVNAGDGFTLPPDAGDFRLMDRAVVDALLALPERNRFMKGLYAWVGFTSVGVPYDPPPRTQGASKFSLRQLVGLSLDGLTGFTTWPLRLASAAGIAMAALSLVYGAYLVASYLMYGHPVSGWTTIVVLLLMFAGIQMLSLGILGEYVARIFEEVKGRPLYIVRRRFGARFEDSRP
jgi:glycosyltransferase involved in cell wall biosynthesis